jgi:hypothetical protein
VRQAVVGKEDFGIHRVMGGDGCWKASPATHNSKIDSIIHRFARMIGFKRAANDEAELQREPSLIRAANGADSAVIKSHDERITKQGRFECFVRFSYPNSDYCKFLDSLLLKLGADQDSSRVEVVDFMAPAALLISAYAQALRGNSDGSSVVEGLSGGGYKYNHIKGLVGAVTATITEFCDPNFVPATCPQLKLFYTLWDDQDKTTSAPAFDMEKDMKICWTAMMSSDWAPIEMIKWSGDL